LTHSFCEVERSTAILLASACQASLAVTKRQESDSQAF
jgi:hypothetical protein